MTMHAFTYTYIHTYIHAGELMAIKEVDCSRAGEAAISDLEAEITMLQQLRHPNIGRVLLVCV